MKIKIIGPAFPYRGGIASYNERLATELDNDGHDVSILTFKVQYPNFLFPGKTQYATESSQTRVKIERGINSVNPFNWFSIGNQLKNEKPDLVIIRFWLPFMGPCFGTILRRLKKNKTSKVICLVDNMIPHEKKPGDRVFTKYFIKPVDAFLAMSESVLNDIKSFDFKKPKSLSPHPLFDNFGEKIDRATALKKLNLSPEYRYILFFGLIRKYKGLDLALEAFADERMKNQKVKLIVAGEYYDDENHYNQIIEKLNLEEKVIQTKSFVPDSEVKNFFNAADVILQPYKSATQSGVTQIAYHFDKPMIVTNVGGLAELCPHKKVGFVVKPDANEIAEALVEFFENGKKYNFEANIIDEKKKYAWNVLVSNFMKLYNQI